MPIPIRKGVRLRGAMMLYAPEKPGSPWVLEVCDCGAIVKIDLTPQAAVQLLNLSPIPKDEYEALVVDVRVYEVDGNGDGPAHVNLAITLELHSEDVLSNGRQVHYLATRGSHNLKQLAPYLEALSPADYYAAPTEDLLKSVLLGKTVRVRAWTMCAPRSGAAVNHVELLPPVASSRRGA